VKLFVSPASFTSFGPWMLLQHFEAKHEVVNVQVVDDTTREAFASDFSPLIPSVSASAVCVCRRPLALALALPFPCPALRCPFPALASLCRGSWPILLNHKRLPCLGLVSTRMCSTAVSPGSLCGVVCPLPCGQLVTSGGVVVKGIENMLRHLAATLPCSSEEQRQALWPSSGPTAVAMRRVLAVVEPLYFRTLQYVLSLLTPLMRPWEARLAEGELQRWDEARRAKIAAAGASGGAGAGAGAGGEESKASGDDVVLASMSLEQLVNHSVGVLTANGSAFSMGAEVSIVDFGLIPAFHILLLAGYPLPDKLLGTCLYDAALVDVSVSHTPHLSHIRLVGLVGLGGLGQCVWGMWGVYLCDAVLVVPRGAS
jgi:hypothetical protein